LSTQRKHHTQPTPHTRSAGKIPELKSQFPPNAKKAVEQNMKKYGKIATSVRDKNDKPFRLYPIFIPAKYCLEGKFDLWIYNRRRYRESNDR
jgi:hypothetical protein